MQIFQFKLNKKGTILLAGLRFKSQSRQIFIANFFIFLSMYYFHNPKAKEWEEAHPEDRKMDFLPKTYDCLRKVPAYRDYIRERFERCLDLYLCPRQRRMRVSIQPPRSLESTRTH